MKLKTKAGGPAGNPLTPRIDNAKTVETRGELAHSCIPEEGGSSVSWPTLASLKREDALAGTTEAAGDRSREGSPNPSSTSQFLGCLL